MPRHVVSYEDGHVYAFPPSMTPVYEAVKTIASAETLEEACELATRDLLDLLTAQRDLSPTDAYMLSSLVGGLEISQVVDPLVTVRCALPSTYLSVPFDA